MRQFDRYLRLRLVCAEPEKLLTSLTLSGITLLNVSYDDLLTVEVLILNRQLQTLKSVVRKHSGSYTVLKRDGLLWKFQSAVKRPVLLFGTLLFLIAVCTLPGRIFFIRVTGNELLSDNAILRQAENCGIYFGAKASSVRSEHVKNLLLGSMESLQWVGITTSGSVATIHVKERSKPENSIEKLNNTVSSVIATRDGVITQMTVKNGNPLCRVGQSVKEGDVLVSGYTDCGIKVKAEQAEAEVFALTLREKTFLTPFPTQIRGYVTEKHTCIQLHIGKKVINLCNHSGIMDAGCVKMYSEDYWSLPGGFRLPVSTVRVDYLYCAPVSVEASSGNPDFWLPQFARSYLQEEMVAGEILSENYLWNTKDNSRILKGEFACHELIGQVKHEEIIGENAENN